MPELPRPLLLFFLSSFFGGPLRPPPTPPRQGTPKFFFIAFLQGWMEEHASIWFRAPTDFLILILLLPFRPTDNLSGVELSRVTFDQQCAYLLLKLSLFPRWNCRYFSVKTVVISPLKLQFISPVKTAVISPPLRHLLVGSFLSSPLSVVFTHRQVFFFLLLFWVAPVFMVGWMVGWLDDVKFGGGGG